MDDANDAELVGPCHLRINHKTPSTIKKMLRIIISSSLLAILLCCVILSEATAFTASPIAARAFSSRSTTTRRTAPVVFLFGPPKDDGSPGDYVCQVRRPMQFAFCKKQTKKILTNSGVFVCMLLYAAGLWLCLYQGSRRVGRIAR
jgi:hypothetical protein